jgi:hypothetical protein
MLICTYFSLNELHFRYNEHSIFVSSAIFTYKLHGHFIFIVMNPYEKFSWKELPSQIEGYLYLPSYARDVPRNISRPSCKAFVIAIRF